MRVLSLQHLFPLPLDSGGKIKSYHMLKALAGLHELRALAYVRNEQEYSMLSDLRQICPVETIYLKRGKLRYSSDLISSLITRKSFIVARDFRAEMHLAVSNCIEQFKPDVIHIDHLQMAQFVDFDGPYRIVLDNHNVESVIIKCAAKMATDIAQRLYATLEWPKLRRYELDVCNRCDRVIVVSNEDKATLLGLDPRLTNVESVPIGVDINHYQLIPRSNNLKNILSIGTMYWPPNIDSMLYFCREILPLIKNDIPECTLTIAGQRPVNAIKRLARDPAISVTGYVDDDRLAAHNCGVFVVPLRSGSGVRVKILNALAMGLPVVSTSVGAEGLDAVNGKHLLIADSPREFADAVKKVLGDNDLSRTLGYNGRELVCAKYSWERVGEQLLSLYDRLET